MTRTKSRHLYNTAEKGYSFSGAEFAETVGERRQTQASAHRTWELVDYVAVTTIILTAFSIVSIPLIPLAPSVFLPFLLYFLVRRRCVRSHVRQVAQLPEVWLLAALGGYQIGALGFTRGIDYELYALAGRIAAAFLLVISLTLYTTSSAAALKRCWNTVFFCCIASFTWFIGEITIEEPFVSLRAQLYNDIYMANSRDYIMYGTSRSGLAPFPHLFGYHLAIILPLLFVTFFMQQKSRIWAVIFSVITIVALSFSAQRSAFGAGVAATALMAYAAWERKRVIKVFRVAFVVGIFLWGVSRANIFNTEGLQHSLTHKLVEADYWQEANFRLMLQFAALELVFTHPWGLSNSGLDWENEGFWPTFRKYHQYVINDMVTVHNGYLGLPLEIGLPFFILTILLLVVLLKRLIIAAMLMKRIPYSPYVASMAAAGGGVIFIQSITHNASFLYQEPICLFSLIFVLSAEVLRRKKLLSHPDLL